MKQLAMAGLAVFLLLAGCASLPGLGQDRTEWLQGELPPDEPGAKMADYRFRVMVRHWLHANGLDPDRCKFDWDGGPDWYEGELHEVAVWKRAVRVNPKDETGRYLGYEPYIFVVRDGRVVDIIGARVTPMTAR
ncbi:MAG: hypothetical protein ACODAQ_11485 [Phycisphaeraceae bacterium]